MCVNFFLDKSLHEIHFTRKWCLTHDIQKMSMVWIFTYLCKLRNKEHNSEA